MNSLRRLPRYLHRTGHRTMATTIKFERLAPAPDAALNSTPIARSSHGISALETTGGGTTRLVLYGGENVARTPIADARQSLWIAENGNGGGGGGWQWISPAPCEGDDGEGGAAARRRWPSPRVAHAQAAVGDVVYVFGGRHGVDVEETALDDLWRLELVADDDGGGGIRARWTEVIVPPGGERPEARSFHKMVSISSDLYVFGGCGSSGRLNDLWKFDTVACEWTGLGCSHVLKGRGGPNVLPLLGADSGAKIAIVAGFAGEETNDGHVYANGKWEEGGMENLSEMRKRSVCSFGSLPGRNRCLIFGGEVDPSAKGHEGAGNFENDVVILDGTTGSYLEVIKGGGARGESSSPWPEARGWADATVGKGDTFYLFGGLAGDDANPVRLDDLWKCQITSA